LIGSVNFENPIKLGNKFELSPIETPVINAIIETEKKSTVTKSEKTTKGLKLSKKKKEEEY